MRDKKNFDPKGAHILSVNKMKNDNGILYSQKLAEPAFNLVLTFLAFLKMLFYLRLFEQFGSIVNLTIQVFQDIRSFIFFLSFFFVFFTFMFELLGAQFVGRGDDYKNLNDKLAKIPKTDPKFKEN